MTQQPIAVPVAPAPSSGSVQLDHAWQAFWDDFGRIREMVYSHPLYGRDEATRTNGNYWLHQMLYVAHSLAVEPRQQYPIFYSTVFQFPLHNTFGLPSPDNDFGLAFVDGRSRYRIWGQRNSVHAVTIVVYHGFWGDENTQAMGEYQLDDFEIAPDGSYEIIASAEDVPGNWLPIDGDSQNVAIMVRHSYLDWGAERRAEMHIERLDIDTERPNLWLSEAELAHRIRTAGRLMVHMATMNNLLPDAVLKATDGRFNIFVDLSGPSVSKFGTFNRAHYGVAVFDCGPDEVVVLEVSRPGADAFYWNLQVGDVFFQTADYVFHQTSLNSTQLTVDDDGKARLVIAPEDPGVPNWLDSMGRTFGVVVFRVYGPQTVEQPTISTVARAELRNHLPGSTPTVDPETRNAALRKRRREAAQRFGF